MSKIRLFCFPYAGGSAVIYNKWQPWLHPKIELIPVELAGRGRRIQEALYKDLPDIIEDVFREVSPKINGAPYALFGHSMGGMIAYELAQKIIDCRLPRPEHIFFSGRRAPHSKRKDRKQYHLMDDDTFIREVVELGGTPPEFFQHPELAELFLPLLRSDFKMSELATYDEPLRPLDTDISVLLGKEEDLIAEECDAWKYHGSRRCTIHYFNGGHFFLHDETEQIVGIINNVLAKKL